MMNNITPISSVNEYLSRINEDINCWNFGCDIAWFRGENKEDTKLIPNLYKKFSNINLRNSFENEVIQEFRMRAVAFIDKTPNYHRIDEWLFLMQHTGLPTRLLDWTEGSLFALFFAINQIVDTENKTYSPVVWMINPIIFNFIANKRFYLPLSWADGSNNYRNKNPYNLELDNHISKSKKYTLRKCPSNIHAAFEAGRCKFEEKYPIALKPQHIHSRVTAQRGCFTVHGSETCGIQEMFVNKTISELITKEHIHSLKYDCNKELSDRTDIIIENILKYFSNNKFNDVFLKKYYINPDKEKIKLMLKELKYAGIGYSTLFPDLDGLSKELTNKY